MTETVEDSTEPMVPLVCRRCSLVQHVTLTSLRANRAIRCASCGERWDTTSISASLPVRIIAPEVERPMASRPFSEFP